MRGLLLEWDDLVWHRWDCMSLVCFDVTECGVFGSFVLCFLEELLYSRIEREPPDLNLAEGAYRQWALMDLATEDRARDWRPPCFGNEPGDFTGVANLQRHTVAATMIGTSMVAAIPTANSIKLYS